jgi:hypothetical protein
MPISKWTFRTPWGVPLAAADWPPRAASASSLSGDLIRPASAVRPHGNAGQPRARHDGHAVSPSVARRLSTTPRRRWPNGCTPAVSPRAPSQPHSGSAVRPSIARSQSRRNGPTESATELIKAPGENRCLTPLLAYPLDALPTLQGRVEDPVYPREFSSASALQPRP